MENITDERLRKRKLEYLVNWVGYQEATWEPYGLVKDTEALENWFASTNHVRKPSGRLIRGWRQLLNKQRTSRTTKGRTTTLAATNTPTQSTLRARTSTPSLLAKRTTSTMILPDTVATSTTPLSSNRDAASKGSEVLLTSLDGSAVIRTEIDVQRPSSMNKKSLEVRRSAGENLGCCDARTGDDRGVVRGARTEDGIEGRIASRTAEVVEDTAQLSLH